MRLDSFFSGALCALSGGRLPEALFMVFYWIPKVQTFVNLADLAKSFLTSIIEYLFAKIGFDTAEERASQSLPKISQQLEKS